ncbi:unnamed protein product, partial [Mesorhabditis spiculigera]
MLALIRLPTRLLRERRTVSLSQHPHQAPSRAAPAASLQQRQVLQLLKRSDDYSRFKHTVSTHNFDKHSSGHDYFLLWNIYPKQYHNQIYDFAPAIFHYQYRHDHLKLEFCFYNCVSRVHHRREKHVGNQPPKYYCFVRRFEHYLGYGIPNYRTWEQQHKCPNDCGKTGNSQPPFRVDRSYEHRICNEQFADYRRCSVNRDVARYVNVQFDQHKNKQHDYDGKEFLYCNTSFVVTHSYDFRSYLYGIRRNHVFRDWLYL